MRIGKAARTALAAAAVLATVTHASADDACMTSVSEALKQQRETYIASQGDLASQNFSRRPGSFASTTCLGNLMQGGGLDIFFKPPSLDSILDMVVNLACQQASQIFDQLIGGGGVNAGSLLSGEIVPGVNLSGTGGITVNPSALGGNLPSGSIQGLFR